MCIKYIVSWFIFVSLLPAIVNPVTFIPHSLIILTKYNFSRPFSFQIRFIH